MGQFDTVDKEFLFRRAAIKWGKWDRDVLSLSVADMDFPAPLEIKQAIIRCVEEDRTPYGLHQGDQEFREILALKIRQRNCIPATADDVLVIPGAMAGIFLSCAHSLRPGDEAILCPSPVYPPFIKNIHLAGATAVHCSLDMRGDRRLDPEELDRLVTDRTRLLMVCNPHNPTGRVLTREELSGIAEVARKHNLTVFCDELYEDMVYEGKHISLASLDEDMSHRTITVFGFSKAFGIPGFRVAYLTIQDPVIQELTDRAHYYWVHADTLAQAAGMAALTECDGWLAEFMDHMRQMRDYVVNRLNGMDGVHCPSPEATPFVFPDLSAFGKSSLDITDYLRDQARVIVQEGSSFGSSGEGCVRINFATSRNILNEAMDRIQAALGLL
ncbi:MAG: pyridoxal phosphate-dependent aminotransferase [Deltaproteobacteria bacterium]|nr:pyridoxal phosphate-dependent aminotransferase [Deltaproteobacteria bacterium]